MEAWNATFSHGGFTHAHFSSPGTQPRASPSRRPRLQRLCFAVAPSAWDDGKHGQPLYGCRHRLAQRLQSSWVEGRCHHAVLDAALDPGRLGSAQARAARASSDQLRAEARSLLKASRDARERTAAELARATARLDAARRLQRLAQDDLDQARERYRLGAADLRALFDAYERLARAEDRELSAKADCIGAPIGSPGPR